MGKEDFDQHLECPTPKHRSKYTTIVKLVITILFPFNEDKLYRLIKPVIFANSSGFSASVKWIIRGWGPAPK